MIIRYSLGFLLACLFVVSSSFVTADAGSGAKYTYGELRFVSTEVGSRDGDGLNFGGSFRVNEEFFVEGSYTDVEFDGDIDASSLLLGGGYIYPYQQFDLVGKLRYIDAEVEDNSEDGFGLAFGTRFYLKEQIELQGFVNYVDVADSDTFFLLAGDYHFNNSFSAGLTLDVGAENDTWTIGGRFYF